MPRQNRVNPFGDLQAVADRGSWMGNRGCLHNASGQVLRPWALRRWIICQLEFKGRRRQLMTPGEYTELFFLDEATALAAGHRPCMECRRADALRFRQLWAQANSHLGLGDAPKFPELDARLHTERLTSDGRKQTWRSKLSGLPSGVLVSDADQTAWLWQAGQLFRWSFQGYATGTHVDRGQEGDVLTPASTVRAIAAGYRPQTHPSVQ